MFKIPVMLKSHEPGLSLTTQKEATGDKSGFTKVLAQAYDEMSSLDLEAQTALKDLSLGNAQDLHTAVLAVEKQSIALDLVISLRNKAVEAYQEIMRMPV